MCSAYVADPHPPVYVGYGGKFYFTIKAGDEAGDGELKLAYDRTSWDFSDATVYFKVPIHII